MTNEKTEKILIGWMYIDQDREYQDSFEAACQYRSVKITSGKYPIYAVHFQSPYPNARHYVSVELTGICNSSGWGSKIYKDEIGKETVLRRHPYKYELRSGKTFNGRFELLENADAELSRVEGV